MKDRRPLSIRATTARMVAAPRSRHFLLGSLAYSTLPLILALKVLRARFELAFSCLRGRRDNRYSNGARGAPPRIRTRNRLVRSELRFPLRQRRKVGRRGFEPRTMGLKGPCSAVALAARGYRQRLFASHDGFPSYRLGRRDLNPRVPATLPTAYKTEGILPIGSENQHRTDDLRVMGAPL